MNNEQGRQINKVSVFCLLLLSGCGWSSWDNEAIGQVKKVQHATPIICSDYDHVDISLGIIRNGIGSVSTQDMWFYVPNPADLALLKGATDSGALVKFTYGVKRFRWCVDKEMITHVELVK
jgi:hypothetical protein